MDDSDPAVTPTRRRGRGAGTVQPSTTPATPAAEASATAVAEDGAFGVAADDGGTGTASERVEGSDG